MINIMIYQWIELGTLFSDNHFVRKILYLKKDLQEFGALMTKIWVFSNLSEMWFQQPNCIRIVWTSSESKFFAMDPKSFPIFPHFSSLSLDQLTKSHRSQAEKTRSAQRISARLSSLAPFLGNATLRTQ